MTSSQRFDEGLGRGHLGWIAAGAGLGFTASFVFADLLRLSAPAYHLVYFVLVGGFVTLYVRWTGLALRAALRRRLTSALVLGVLGGLVLMRRVIAEMPSSGPSGILFAWDLLWRGLVYGTVDGVLLSAFPWLVVWRALRGESASFGKRLQLIS